jgi:hypothetical protein
MHAFVRWQFRGDIPKTGPLEKLPTAITVLPVGAFLPAVQRPAPRPRRREYRAAHALMPPLRRLMNGSAFAGSRYALRFFRGAPSDTLSLDAC